MKKYRLYGVAFLAAALMLSSCSQHGNARSDLTPEASSDFQVGSSNSGLTLEDSSESHIESSSIISVSSNSIMVSPGETIVIASIPSKHEGLSQVDLIIDEVGYGLELYFEPMDWDSFDNETRVDIAKSALEYAFTLIEEYSSQVVTYAGYTSSGELIIFNNSSFYIVVTNTDGSNIYGAEIWP